MKGSMRWRGQQTFVVCDHSADRGELELMALRFTDAFVTWEAQGIVLSSGHRLGARYVLWVPCDARPVELELEDLATLLVPPPPPELVVVHTPQPAARRRGPKTTRHKGITRVDRLAGRKPDGRKITATHGYMARVPWRGKVHIKFFSDSVHGDRLGALAAALEWRDATEQLLGKPRTDEPVFSVANSNTGYVGIHRQLSPQGKPEFEVSWVGPDGRNGRTSVSIAKHGERKALRKALKIRAERERERLGVPG